MEKWDIMSSDVNLSSLYDLLREQFRNPEDPWYIDTVKWWNEYVQVVLSGWPIIHEPYPAMCSPTLPAPKNRRTLERWRD